MNKSITRRGFLEGSMLTAAVAVGSPLPGRAQENKTASPAAQPPHQSIAAGSALPAEKTTPGREMDGTHIPIPLSLCGFRKPPPQIYLFRAGPRSSPLFP